VNLGGKHRVYIVQMANSVDSPFQYANTIWMVACTGTWQVLAIFFLQGVKNIVLATCKKYDRKLIGRESLLAACMVSFLNIQTLLSFQNAWQEISHESCSLMAAFMKWNERPEKGKKNSWNERSEKEKILAWKLISRFFFSSNPQTKIIDLIWQTNSF